MVGVNTVIKATGNTISAVPKKTLGMARPPVSVSEIKSKQKLRTEKELHYYLKVLTPPSEAGSPALSGQPHFDPSVQVSGACSDLQLGINELPQFRVNPSEDLTGPMKRLSPEQEKNYSNMAIQFQSVGVSQFSS